jgi:hypothetical protein
VQDADTLTKSTAGVDGFMNRFISASASTYTSSVYIKKDSNQTRFPEIFLRSSDGLGQNEVYVQLNTATGATAIRFQNGTAVVNPPILVNGYWRVTITIPATANNCRVGIRPAAGTTLGVIDINATGSVVAWGFQLEAGSYATSYIPTTSASVTRNADGNGTLINAQTLNDFVLFYDGLFFDDNVIIFGSGANSAWYVSLSPSLNRVVVDLASGRKYESFNGNIVINQRIKIAIKRASGVIDIFLNGVKLTPNIQVTDTTALSLSSVGWSFSSTFFGRGRMNSAAAWQISLSDAQCQTLTTL